MGTRVRAMIPIRTGDIHADIRLELAHRFHAGWRRGFITGLVTSGVAYLIIIVVGSYR